MENIKIINKHVVEKIICDIQKIQEMDSATEVSVEKIQNNPKRQIEKFLDTLSIDEQTDLYALMLFGKEIFEKEMEMDFELFAKNRKYAKDLIEQNGFHANYLTSKVNLSLYFNKSLKIYEILNNCNKFIF